MKKVLAGILSVALLSFFAPSAQAQVALGPQLSLADDVDFGIGAVLETPLTAFNDNLEFSGAFTLFFPDAGDYWELEGSIRYLFPNAGDGSFIPFVSAGIGIGRFSWDSENAEGSDSEVGLKLGGGLKFPMEKITPFAELGLGIGDLPDFTLRGGLTFMVGGGGSQE